MQYNWMGDHSTIEQEITGAAWESDKPDWEQGEAKTTARFAHKGKYNRSNFLCSVFWRPSFRKPLRDALMSK